MWEGGGKGNHVKEGRFRTRGRRKTEGVLKCMKSMQSPQSPQRGVRYGPLLGVGKYDLREGR